MSEILHQFEKEENYPLKVHQGSALVKAQEDHILQNIPSLSEMSFSPAANDGTNACVFLSLKISEVLISKEEELINWEDLRPEVEQIVEEFPAKINYIRDKDKCYGVEEADHIVHRYRKIRSLKLERKGKVQYSSLNSGPWRAEMTRMLEELQGVSIFIVPPYAFVVANLNE